MAVTELDSFVKKFYQLWNAGHVAHLDVDSYAGKAWVGLRVQLGHAPGPLHQQVHQHHKKSDSPSRQRRRARRAAARVDGVDAENATNPPTTEVIVIQETVKVSNEDCEVAEEAASDNNEIVPAAAAEEAVAAGFDCSTCGKTYKTERGLNSHGRQAHKSIPQFDGTSDELELPFIFESEFAKEDVLYTLEEVLTDEINVELISRTKVDDDIRSGDYVFSIRVSPPNMDWNWPVMNTIQREVLKNLRNGSSSCC